jgi:hypothetical protein
MREAYKAHLAPEIEKRREATKARHEHAKQMRAKVQPHLHAEAVEAKEESTQGEILPVIIKHAVEVEVETHEDSAPQDEMGEKVDEGTQTEEEGEVHILPYFGEEPKEEIRTEIDDLIVGFDDVSWGSHGDQTIDVKPSLEAEEEKFLEVTDKMKQQASIKFTNMIGNLFKQVKEMEVKFELPTFPSLW